MEHDLNVWKSLYETAKAWKSQQPWFYLRSNDWIQIDFPDEETIYCSIMGNLGTCTGLSIYQGDQGLADLMSISIDCTDTNVIQYLMYEQKCITFYLGNRDEVPKAQKKIIKQLGMRFRGNGNWPYFISFEKHYAPDSINEQQAILLTKVMSKLLEIVDIYTQSKIDVIFDDDEMIYAHVEDNNWIYETICITEQDKFMPVDLDDQELLQQLKQCPQSDINLCLDLFYLNTYYFDENSKRPINPLMFIVVDEESEMIIYQKLLTVDDDEISIVLSFIVEFILQYDRPQQIIIRNPTIWAAINNLCEECRIKLDIVSPLPLIDEIIDEFNEFMD